MRQIVFLGAPIPGRETDWIMEALREIERASAEENYSVTDAFTVLNLGDPVRTLDVATATATDVAKVLGTLLQDMKRRGATRGA